MKVNGIMDFAIIDDTEGNNHKVENNIDKLSDHFGRNLDTLEKARLWATNPNNWHEGKLFLVKWDGLLCTVSREVGLRLQVETWDNGIPWAIMYGQSVRRAKRERGEELDEREVAPLDDSIS